MAETIVQGNLRGTLLAAFVLPDETGMQIGRQVELRNISRQVNLLPEYVVCITSVHSREMASWDSGDYSSTYEAAMVDFAERVFRAMGRHDLKVVTNA